MKVNRIPVTPVPDAIHVELSIEEASGLQYFFGRLSNTKIRAVIEGGSLSDTMEQATLIHNITSPLYFALYEILNGD